MTQFIAHLFGDYILQSDWMAQNKTKRSWPALVHAFIYSLCFVPLCWQAVQHIPERRIDVQPTRVVIHTADFTSKAVNIDGSYKEPAQDIPDRFHIWVWLVILSTHFLIDRFRLARYVVWAKNWLGPWSRMETVGEAVERMKASGEMPRPVILPGQKIDIVLQRIRFIAPLSDCQTGYPPSTPIWLSTWLLIIADNTIHLAINYAALKYL